MAQVQSARPRASLPKQFANFTNRTAGLDLTLRLIQALSQVAAEVSTENGTVMRCIIATSQLALARRYLRFFSFIDCFERAYDSLLGKSPSQGFLWTTMDVAESSCLALYFLIEDSTILHDMDIWVVPWYAPVLMEANKFWVYAICISITRALGELLFGSPAQNKPQKKKKSAEKPSSKQGSSIMSLFMRLLADGCDMTLPTSFLGWISLGDLGIGIAMAVSTLIAAHGVWAKAQP